MARIQTSRGNIAVKQAAQPLLSGELFVDTTTEKGYQLYVGTGGSGNYEWGPIVKQATIDGKLTTIMGPEGAYRKIGTTNAIGFFDVADGTDNHSYFTDVVPENPIIGAMYIISKDIQVSTDQTGLFVNIDSDGVAETSTPELKKNDIIIYTGYQWVKINNAGGTAKDSEFYSKLTQAPQTTGASNIQDAIVALDGQKLAYKGLLFGSKDITPGTKLNLSNGENDHTFVFKTVEDTPVAKLPNGQTTAAELGTVEGTVWLVDVECTINGAAYEQGDFLLVTATKPWTERDTVKDADGEKVNERVLKAADVTLTHVPGGTHEPSKIYITKEDLPRETHGDHIYGDEEINNVKDALQKLFGTKADLDSNGKILLAQLPDTIIGAMEYQGAYDGKATATVTIDETKVGTLTDGSKTYNGFTLPTVANKSSNELEDDDAKTDKKEGNYLVKGDYWIYNNSAYKWDITSLVEAGTISSSGLNEVDGKVYITNGDWIVYNGNDTWSVIDNTDAFIGVKSDGKTLQGTVEIKGKNRNSTTITETTTSVEGQVITIEAPNAVLAPDGVSQNVIYKSGSADDKTAVASNLTDDGKKLTIVESRGIDLTTGSGNSDTSVTATIVGNDTNATLKLPNIDTTLAANEDLGIVDAADDKKGKGTDWFAAMYRTEANREVIRNSFIKFLGTETSTSDKKLKLSGIELLDETSANHKVDILLSNDTGTTTQVLPRVSGYLLNSNSIIDCGVWSDDGTVKYPTEGFVQHGNKIYRNGVTYGSYQTDEEDDAKDVVDASSEEIILAHISES